MSLGPKKVVTGFKEDGKFWLVRTKEEFFASSYDCGALDGFVSRLQRPVMMRKYDEVNGTLKSNLLDIGAKHKHISAEAQQRMPANQSYRCEIIRATVGICRHFDLVRRIPINSWPSMC